MQNTVTVIRQDDEDIQHSKLYGRHREEVDRDHLADVVSKERHPGLRWVSCRRRIPQITRRRASDTVRDSASATGMNQSLAAHPHLLDLAAVLLSPSERDAC